MGVSLETVCGHGNVGERRRRGRGRMIEAKRTRAGEHAGPLQRKVVKPTRTDWMLAAGKLVLFLRADSRRQLAVSLAHAHSAIANRSTVRHLPAARKAQGRMIGQS